MNIHQTAMLNQLAREDRPQYASKLIKRTQRWKLYTTEEMTNEVLMPLVRAGLVTHIVVNKCNKFQITQLGIDVVDGGNQAEPPEIVQPRTRPFVAWDGRQRWDTASERGCHRGIGSVGVAC
jgi:hypothetical protein